MRLKQFNKLLISSFLVASYLNANELKEQILSSDRLELFNLTQEQIVEESSKLRKEWINPITYKLSKTYNDGNHDPLRSTIAVNQPIFRSGGIFQAIYYAESFEKYSNLDLESQKIELIKDAFKLLFEIHTINFTIKKQELLIANSDLEILKRREQVLNGISDTSLLDNAILDANTNKNNLAELVYQKNELINSFNSISSATYETFELPEFTLINSEDYLENNLNILKIQEDVNNKNYLNLLTISNYLPSINFTYDYTKYHDDYDPRIITQTNEDVIGLNLTIPFDFSTFNDIQSSKIDYLKSKLSLNTTILEEENFYKTALSKIDMIDSKMNIARHDFELYDSLLNDIVQAANAGLSSYADVKTLENSKEIKSYDIKILRLEKQLELLELYAKKYIANK